MNKKLFFDDYRLLLDKDKTLTPREVEALNTFLELVECNPDYFSIKQWAYVFATVFHETAFTFEPVKEAFHLSENWRKRNLRYYPYYGRGYVQLTWGYNYVKYGIEDNPDVALEPAKAFYILIDGMKNGVFTGRRLDKYVTETKANYEMARYVINGRDKREVIAKYAETFEHILEKTFKKVAA